MSETDTQSDPSLAPASGAGAETQSRDRTALVTGGYGFMGQKLCRRLADAGWSVRATDLESAADGTLEDAEAIEFVPGDLTDPETLDAVVADVDDVFHTASLFSYASHIPWERFVEINVEGTRNLCEALASESLDRFVHWSSVGVYGPPDHDKLPITEDHPKRPESNYDRSKYQQEQVIQEYVTDQNLPALILRPAPVYGPGNTYGIAQLWFAIAKGYLQVFPAYCDYKLPLVHADDVIAASVYLADHGEVGTAYNVIDDQEYELRDVVQFVAELVDSHIYMLPAGNRFYRSLNALRRIVPWIERRYRANDEEPPFERDALFYLKGNFHISNERLRTTGYEPAYPDYKAGLIETIEWYREEGLI